MRVSVVLAVNRYDDYLPLSINSILNQTFIDFEFIIVANNCTDDLWDYLIDIANSDSRIKIFRTSIGQLVFNLNYGIDLAKGEYIARMDADDISLPDRLMKQVALLDADKDINLCGTNISKIDIQGNIIETSCQKVFSNKEIRKAMKFYNPIVHPSIMFRRKDFIAKKGYLWTNWAEDYEYHLRCARDDSYKFHVLNDILLYYRISDKQMTSNNNDINNYANECSLMYREYLYTGNIKFLFRILRLNLFLRKIKNLLLMK